ncbi:zinc finger protein 124-like [Dendronephthya gigantea]|uniref:zinc finger protein 124-like n=1 Tax=Dendronephthya gigantea TaxID=151771 RepID=UPI00106CA45C|nr:zinc finger protein 124-like [Dendronephthya gigantea]
MKGMENSAVEVGIDRIQSTFAEREPEGIRDRGTWISTSEVGIQADFSEESDLECYLSEGDLLTTAEDKKRLNASSIPAHSQSASGPLAVGIRTARKAIELKYIYGDDLSKNDIERLSKADVLVPPGLLIKNSTIPNAGHGVFANCEIPKHEFFGPYLGKIIDAKDAKNYKQSHYVWEVKDDFGKLVHLVDGSDASQSNWLRFVNFGRKVNEQNVRPVQYENNIYYMVTRDIFPNEELLLHHWQKQAKNQGTGIQKRDADKSETFQCRNCNKTYSEASSLIGHLKYKCNNGKQRSIFVPQPTDHEDPFKVDIPDEVVVRENEKMKKFQCSTCGKRFIRNYTLQCHMLIHTGKKDHVCETCGKAFSLAKHLQRHSLVHSGLKPYKCHLCGKSFSQQGSLQAHSRTHTGIKPYKCDVCGRAFSLQSPLLSHLKTHNAEKAYKCSTCNKEFTHRNTLLRHELIHSGTRPYTCTVCGKAFTQTNDLKRHSRIHSGIRPYQCHICGKAFTVEFTLVCHVRTHTGVRPYSCDYCSKTFTQPGARLKHIRKAHPDKPLPPSAKGRKIRGKREDAVNKQGDVKTGDDFVR